MKAALVINDDFSMWHFRKGLLAALVKKGVEVCVLTPGKQYVSKFESLGARHIEIPMVRFIDPIKDLKAIRRLLYIFRKERFDIVHTMTIKPNIYGGLAARITGVRRVVGLVSGRGIMFADTQDPRLKLTKPFVALMYRVFFKIADKVWFQNIDDLSFFVNKGYLDRRKAVYIKSGGINTSDYSLQSVNNPSLSALRHTMGANESDILVTMISARMIWSKGVKEFVEAAQRLTSCYPRVKFLLVGPIEDDAPDSVPLEYLKQNESAQLRMCLEFRDDVKEIIAVSDIITLPSYYPEGIPRVLLEALALSKPVVTTTNVGCREVVIDGYNGFLVPPKDPTLLANALEKLIIDADLRTKFGENSRVRAEREFDESIVVEKVLRELYQIV